MFGFIVGTLSLIGLIKVARWGRRGHGGRWGGFWLRRLFERLDTTPGQERVIMDAADEARRAMWHARDEMFRARGEYARALRAEQFDAAAIDAAFARQQASIDEAKETLKAKLGAIHEALDPRQRSALADLVEFGPHRMSHCGPRHHFTRGPMGPTAVNV